MKINTKYNIDQSVYIPELKIKGKILAIYFNTPDRIQYFVRYFDNFSPKEVYFLEDELSLQEKNKGLGFIKNEQT